MSITNQGPPWWKVLVGCHVPNVDAVLTADVEGHEDVALKDFQRDTTNNGVNQYIDMMMHLYYTNMYIYNYIDYIRISSSIIILIYPSIQWKFSMIKPDVIWAEIW